ncbi:MAG: peptidylprolyl isomerase [Chitinophagaceae bacterium]|nr:peptidylprolyl isomerase [Chitinophagaceae bacterium]
MILRFILAVSVLTLCSCSSPKFKNPHIRIQTKIGNIEIELFGDKAPQTVTAILAYIDSGLYKDASFYRVLNMNNQPSDAPKAELIQGGLWNKIGIQRDLLPGIQHENTRQSGILHTNGVISLARQEPGTANTEFFICVGDQPGFDYGGENNSDGQGYAAFGKVVKGMDIVRRIYDMHEDDQYFDPPVPIFTIERL